MGWDRPFDQPIPLPIGPPARTLRDAANYIKTLPKFEHDTPEWRLAVQMLIDAAEDRGPMLFAKMGMLRAIEHDPNAPADWHDRRSPVPLMKNRPPVSEADPIRHAAYIRPRAPSWFDIVVVIGTFKRS